MSYSMHQDDPSKESQSGYSERGKTAGYPTPPRREYNIKTTTR